MRSGTGNPDVGLSGPTDGEIAEARGLAARGDDEAARGAYLALLARHPTDFRCLTELGRLAFAGGFRSAAQTVYAQAVAHHPHEPIGHVNLGNVLRADGDPAAAKQAYRAALDCDPGCAPAHQGLALVLADEGDAEAAARHRERGFRGQAIVRRPYRGTGSAPRVLLLVSARGGIIPTDLWLDDRHYDVTAIYTDYADLTLPLPPHDLLFNAIGDADLCGEALRRAVALCARSRQPLLNRPDRVLATGRADTATLLAGIVGVRTPEVRALAPAAIRDLTDLTFPVLLRRPGFHTGQHFHRAETRAALMEALAGFERDGAETVLLIAYMDARGADGLARKYRVMSIDGDLYPLHLAISPDWKVHYFTAAMAEDAAHRAEEQRFLDDPQAVLGSGGMAALRAIADRLGLDYGGIDFGLAADGTILVFEANATMVLIPPDPAPIWDYRRPAIGRTFQAAERMLRRRIGAAT